MPQFWHWAKSQSAKRLKMSKSFPVVQQTSQVTKVPFYQLRFLQDQTLVRSARKVIRRKGRLKTVAQPLGKCENGQVTGRIWSSLSAATLECGAESDRAVPIYRASRRSMPEVSNFRQHRWNSIGLRASLDCRLDGEIRLSFPSSGTWNHETGIFIIALFI